MWPDGQGCPAVQCHWYQTAGQTAKSPPNAQRPTPNARSGSSIAAAELNYTPNSIALSLRNQQTSTIGIITDDIVISPFAGRLISGASRAALARGYMVPTADRKKKMLFLARMDVQFPPHLQVEEITRMQGLEKEYSPAIQRDGRLLAIWRVVGEYANYSVFNVESNDHLHTILSGFPMYPYLKIKVTPLATHPNSIG